MSDNDIDLTKGQLIDRLVTVGQTIIADEATPLKVLADYCGSLKEAFPELTNDDIKTITYLVFRMK